MARYFRENEDGSLVPVDLEEEGFVMWKKTEEPKQTDWNRYKGCVVEVSDNNDEWLSAFYANFVEGSMSPHLVDDAESDWKYCRLPSSLTVGLLPHDGSSKCPIHPEHFVIYSVNDEVSVSLAKAKFIGFWEEVTAYLPINFVLPE